MYYIIKGVVGQKRKVKADKPCACGESSSKKINKVSFSCFSRLPQQLGIGMEQHIKFLDVI
jgi:hypothetical protein